MGILKGALTVRRYRAEGEVPTDFRERYQEALNDHAFRDPKQPVPGQEVAGWCQVHNLLDTEFSNYDKWLYNQFLMAALRIDKRALPGKLFKAHLDKRIQLWLTENERQKCPSKVKTEIKEALELEMLAKTLPRVATFEFCWNITDSWVVFHNTSEGPNDLFRKLFRQTFGITLTPASPLDLLLAEPEVQAKLEMVGISDYRVRSEERK